MKLNLVPVCVAKETDAGDLDANGCAKYFVFATVSIPVTYKVYAKCPQSAMDIVLGNHDDIECPRPSHVSLYHADLVSIDGIIQNTPTLSHLAYNYDATRDVVENDIKNTHKQIDIIHGFGEDYNTHFTHIVRDPLNN